MNIEDVQEEQSKEAGQESDQKEDEEESDEEEGEDESREDTEESDASDSHSDLESNTESEEEHEKPKSEQHQTPGRKLPSDDQRAQKAAGAELPYVFAGRTQLFSLFCFQGWDSVLSLVGFACFPNNGPQDALVSPPPWGCYCE